VTLAPKGLLIEESRTNLLLQSQAFNNAAYAPFGVDRSTFDTQVAPDGTTTADTIIETTITGVHRLDQAGFSVSGVVTLSIFAKLGLGSRFLVIGLSRDTTNTGSATFDLSNGTNTQTQANGAYSSPTATITAVSQGFYRCTLTITVDTANLFRVALSDTSTPTTGNRAVGADYLGDGTSSLILWGAQLESGSFSTSYIPTTTAAATRAADVAVMTGANFSNWYNQSEGTLFAEALTFNSNVSKYPWSVHDGSQAELIAPYFLNANGGGFVVDGSVTQVQIEAAGLSIASKIALAVKANDFALSINGSAVTTDTSGTMPTPGRAQLGNRADGNRTLNGHIKRIAYFPRRLSDAELQGVTA
jgi:hypothetical protein